MSNYDMVRKMTLHEMAEFITGRTHYQESSMSARSWSTAEGYTCYDYQTAVASWEAWLMKESNGRS